MAAQKEKKPRHWDVPVSHKVRHTVITIFVTLLCVGGGAYGYFYFTQDVAASITPSQGIGAQKTIAAPAATNLQFDEPAFSFKLPPDWKKTGELTTGPYRKFSFQATQKNADNRYLDIYLDAVPLNMAVNKVVAVEAEGQELSHGMVSTNCIEFTQKIPGQFMAPAKWDGVNFLCDTESTARNVIGTSSPGNVNKVELATVGSAKRALFFVYTDHNYNPDYGIFYDFLDSFSVK